MRGGGAKKAGAKAPASYAVSQKLPVGAPALRRKDYE